jgi:hypothetical protein
VKQHFPKRTQRSPLVDFRLPTATELSAIEAFLLSIGRQEDPLLVNVDFDDPELDDAKLFFTGIAACGGCHANGGANRQANENPNTNTGVEEFLVNRIPPNLLAGEPRPVDGGFGHDEFGGFGTIDPNEDGSIGDRTFNSQTVIEFADTLPAFHNNLTITSGDPEIVDTVEGAVRFYLSDEFVALRGDLFPNLDPVEEEEAVLRIGRLLRALNALENERQTTERAERVFDLLEEVPIDEDAVKRLLRIAIADTEDAIDVLEGVDMEQDAQDAFRSAKVKLAGGFAGDWDQRQGKVAEALALLDVARAAIICPTSQCP